MKRTRTLALPDMREEFLFTTRVFFLTSTTTSMDPEETKTIKDLRSFLNEDHNAKFANAMHGLDPDSPFPVKKVHGDAFKKKVVYTQAFHDATTLLKETCDQLNQFKSSDILHGSYTKRKLRPFESCSNDAKRKRLDGVIDYILENVVGDVQADSDEPLTHEERSDICYNVVIPRLISYNKSEFGRLSDAVLSSPLIAKKAASLMERGVKEIENNPDFIAFEWIKNKELGLTLNTINKVKKGHSHGRRKLDLGVLGECDLPVLDITRSKEALAKEHIASTFPGGMKNICTVQILDHIFLVRHAIFRLAGLLNAVLLSLDNETCDKYRIWFRDENGAPLEWLYTVAFPIDGTKMPASGVGAKGGDAQVTMVLAQLLNYPLSIGMTTSNYLLGILNCAETKIYLKIFLLFLKREAQVILDEKLQMTFRDGTTRFVTFRFRSKGDMKWQNVAQSCGTQSCDVPLAHFMVSSSFLQLTWFVKIEKRHLGQPFEFSRQVTEVNPHTNEMHTMRYLCAHMPTIQLAEKLCNDNNGAFLQLRRSDPARSSEKTHIDTVRKLAYANGNNFLCTLGFNAIELAVKNGCNFQAPCELYPLQDPLEHSETALELFGICPPLFQVTYDALHLNSNKHKRALQKIITSCETRSLAQGAAQHEFTISTQIGNKTTSSTFSAFDFHSLADHIVLKKVLTAIQLVSPAVGKRLIAYHDQSKSAEERTKAGRKDPNGKEATNFIRKSSLICKALQFEGETENMEEVRIASHLYMHLAKSTGDKHMKYLLRFFRDELILENIGIVFHKLCILYGFGCPPNSFGHMRGLPAQLKDDRVDLRVSQIEFLGPRVSSSAQSSEGCNFRFREFFDMWSNKGPQACVQVAVTYLYVYVLGRAFIKPRTHAEMGSLTAPTVLAQMRLLDQKSTFFPLKILAMILQSLVPR